MFRRFKQTRYLIEWRPPDTSLGDRIAGIEWFADWKRYSEGIRQSFSDPEGAIRYVIRRKSGHFLSKYDYRVIVEEEGRRLSYCLFNTHNFPMEGIKICLTPE
jgi:hypothetical protein